MVIFADKSRLRRRGGGVRLGIRVLYACEISFFFTRGRTSCREGDGGGGKKRAVMDVTENLRTFLPSPFLCSMGFPPLFLFFRWLPFSPFSSSSYLQLKRMMTIRTGNKTGLLSETYGMVMKGKRNNQARRGGGAMVYYILFQKVSKFHKRRRRTLLCIP